jgi:acyl-CoA synthetase (AMP-forming)/AMP-acid ligase II
MARSNAIANRLLKCGLKRGDKVATLLNNSIVQLEVMLGTIAAGCVTVPLSVLMAKDSLATMINNSEAKILFASGETLEQVEPLRQSLKGIAADGDFISVDSSKLLFGHYFFWLFYFNKTRYSRLVGDKRCGKKEKIWNARNIASLWSKMAVKNGLQPIRTAYRKQCMQGLRCRQCKVVRSEFSTLLVDDL